MHWLGPNIEWLLFVKMSKMPQYLKFYMDWILVTKDLLAVGESYTKDNSDDNKGNHHSNDNLLLFACCCLIVLYGRLL